MNVRSLAVLLVLSSAAATPALCENSLSNDPPKPAAKATPPAKHKAKTASTPKNPLLLPTGPEEKAAQKPASGSVPMDFSGMAKRPVDLDGGTAKSDSSSSPREEGLRPNIGSSSGGGITPGMGFSF